MIMLHFLDIESTKCLTFLQICHTSNLVQQQKQHHAMTLPPPIFTVLFMYVGSILCLLGEESISYQWSHTNWNWIHCSKKCFFTFLNSIPFFVNSICCLIFFLFNKGTLSLISRRNYSVLSYSRSLIVGEVTFVWN